MSKYKLVFLLFGIVCGICLYFMFTLPIQDMPNNRNLIQATKIFLSTTLAFCTVGLIVPERLFSIKKLRFFLLSPIILIAMIPILVIFLALVIQVIILLVGLWIGVGGLITGHTLSSW